MSGEERREQLIEAVADVIHDLGCIADLPGVTEADGGCEALCHRHPGDGEHLIAAAVVSWLPKMLEEHPEAFAAALGMNHRRDAGYGRIVHRDGVPLLFHDPLNPTSKEHVRHVLDQPWTEVPS